MATKTNTSINGQDYFRIRRVVGHKMVEGKKQPIYKSFYGTSKTNAEKLYREYINEQARIKYEGDLIMDTATLASRATEYINNVLKVSTKYATGTKISYEGAYRNHIEGTDFSKMIVKDIKAADIQSFYNGLDVTKPTLKRINKFMSAFWKWMVRNNYARDIMSAIELPQKEENKKHDEIVVWDSDDLHYLVSQHFDFRYDFLIKLMSYSGMRISECLGLKYSDIYDDTIHVSRQYYLDEIKAPKYNSKREIPMHPELIKAFRKHKIWHEKEMIKRRYKTDYVITTQYGTLCDVSNLRRAFTRFYKRIGIQGENFHAYRASFCTNLCKAGVPLEVASKLMGHKSLEVTAKHYALIHKETKREAIDKLAL